MSHDTDLPSSCYEVPARIASLGFRVDLPSDWQAHELPDESLNFDDPRYMVSLSVITAQHSALVFAVAARPAFDDGTVSDWSRYLIAEAGLSPRTQGEGQLGDLPALLGEAVLKSDAGPMLVRYAFAEDGGRFLNLTLTAPLMLAGALQGVWSRVLTSFTLDDPRGATVPVWPAATVPEQVPQPAHDMASDDASTDEPTQEATQEPTQEPTDIWEAACALEQAGRLQEAEQVLLQGIDHQGALLTVAQLHLERHLRLRRAGDGAGAAQAAEAATRWAHAYAASATSGGEGLALSRERDALLARLNGA